MLVTIFAVLLMAFVTGYLLGISQSGANPNLPKRTNTLNFGPVHFTVTADVMGLIILSILAALILTTGLLAILAHHRRKRVQLVEKEAVETRVQLATIVESSDDAIISKSLDGTITSWNRGATKLFGYTAAEMIGQPMARLFPADLVNEEPRILARIARGEVVDHFETVRLDKQGKPIDISTRVSPLADNTGKIIGAANIARDITERKQADRKLQDQLARLDLLQQITRAMDERQDMESIFQVVIHRLVADLPLDLCCVCLADPAAETVTAASIGVQGESLAVEMLLPEQSAIDVKATGLSHFMRGQLVYEPDVRVLSLPFPEQLVRAGLHSLVVTPLLVEGKLFGILLAARREAHKFTSGECEFLRQLGEHVALAAHQTQLYSSLQKAYDDLRQTQLAVMQQERLRALGQMASGIAHDINNAISPMMLYTESLLETEQNLSPRGRKGLQVIERAVDDVSATVARLSDFYRQREPQLRFMRVQPGNLLQQVLDLTRARWSDMPQKRGVVIDVQIDSAPRLPAIMGVEAEIREALTNLVFNAVDAMPDGGKLVLRTRATEDKGEGRDVQVEVSDTGTGMDEETRRRCVEPFFTTKGERGTGLGLAMVYGMAERHGGDVEIESEVGRGTTIRLSFPIVDFSAERAAQTGEPLATVAPQRILIVDDDAVVLKTLSDVLSADGHLVVGANGGQQGIEAFNDAFEGSEAFDVVVTDLGMPYVDGNQVAAAIKKLSPATPVILFSGWGQRVATEKELPAHIDYVLSKPPKLRELRQALIHCCQKSGQS
jgi:PAS domain S-box-containing protein